MRKIRRYAAHAWQACYYDRLREFVNCAYGSMFATQARPVPVSLEAGTGRRGEEEGMLGRQYIFDRSSPEPNSGCWLWTGTIDRLGYARFGQRRNDDGKLHVLVHRMAYESFVGPIPQDRDILHRCDVRCCVNPDHLFVGTHADNMADMKRKGRARSGNVYGEAHGAAKLKKEMILEIRASNDSNKALAGKFGVDPSTISLIRSRLRWKHVTE